MHLCFVDESGTPAKGPKSTPQYFVIAGLIVPEERWHNLANRLKGLKIRKRYRGEIKWRYFAPNNTDAANPMAKWPHEDRCELRREVFSIITSDRSIRIVAGVSEARTAYNTYGVSCQNDIYYRTYKVVTERFQYALQDMSKSSGRTTCGIIIADHRGRGDDEQLRNQHRRLVETEQSYTSTYTHLIEGLFLTPSHMSVGVQLADMVAGAVWRRFEKNDATSFNLILPSFRRSSGGQLDGFGIARFPKREWQGVIVKE